MTHARPITAALALALTATLLAAPGLLPDAEAKERDVVEGVGNVGIRRQI